MITISVCMIVKDEELCIKTVLECAKKFADEIIIVDTGSKDKTKEIAKIYTDKIYDFTWDNNFAKARNYSFSIATKDYIMWLDADDYITNENIQKILDLKNTLDTNVDIVMMKYLLDNLLEYYRERLVKRENNYLWKGYVHEAITPTREYYIFGYIYIP